MADDTSKSRSGNPFGWPDFDLAKMLENYRVPGLDVGAMLEREQRNLQAFQQASETMAEGWRKLAERQGEIFRESMDQWRQAVERGLSGGQIDPEQQADMMRKGFEQALANMRELADMANQSQAAAYDIVRKRMEESVGEYFGSGDPQKE